MLSTLLLARDEAGAGLSDEKLHDELITAVIAGHETAATVLAWAFERILLHVDVHERLQQEVRGADAHALAKSALLDQVLYEVLRQRPPFPLVARRVCAPWQLRDWLIPEGVTVAPCLHLTHQRSDVFEEPAQFRPERWAGVKPSPFLLYPFGGGVRRCLGMAFALLEMKLIVGAVLQRARLRLERPAPIDVVRRTITLFPKGGTRVVVDEVHGPS